MSSATRSLLKVFVRAFYLENASFFLFVIGLTGGFMSDIEHIALAQFFISNAYLIAIPAVLWAIYAMKIINFNRSVLLRAENSFLFNLILYPKASQWSLGFIIAALQFMPAVFYGVFLALFAFREKMYLPILPVVGSLLIICFVVVKLLIHRIHRPDYEAKVGWLSRMMNKFTRPYPAFLIEWVGRRHFLVLIVIKILSGIFLFAILKLYTTDVYDSRLLGMAMVVATGMGSQLIFEIHRFENFHFMLVRQLPVSLLKRMLNTLTSFILISVLEAGVVITYFPDYLSFLNVPEVLLFFYSCQLFLYCNLYRKALDQEQFMKTTFTCSMVWIVLVLFKAPIAILIVANVVIGVYFFMTFYYRFEPVTKNPK